MIFIDTICGVLTAYLCLHILYKSTSNGRWIIAGSGLSTAIYSIIYDPITVTGTASTVYTTGRLLSQHIQFHVLNSVADQMAVVGEITSLLPVAVILFIIFLFITYIYLINYFKDSYIVLRANKLYTDPLIMSLCGLIGFFMSRAVFVINIVG